MNYEEMSDFEINWKVAEVLGLRCIHERGGVVCYQMQFGGSCVIDYCNNPSDAWPIIFSNRITVSLDDDIFAYSGAWCDEITGAYAGADFECYCENPLRAAMIVFLMMKEKQHDGSK